MTNQDQNHTQYISLAADIVSAFVANNPIPASELPGLINTVHSSLAKIASGSVVEAEATAKEPAVSIKKSVAPDFVICLEDGKKFKSLKRHLASKYGLTPEQYRIKWGLPADYPMVAPAYAAIRSKLAKKIGLGVKPAERKRAAAEQSKKREKTLKGPVNKAA